MPETKKLLLKNSGFTLIELLVAMAMSSILMTAVASTYWTQMKTSREQQMVVEMQQSMRAAIYMLERDFMMAGYDDNPDDTFSPTITLAQFDINGNPEIGFTLIANDDGIDNDGDGSTDEGGEMETIHYRLYDSSADPDNLTDDLQRQPGGPPIAGNIDSLEFYYTLTDGTQTVTPANPQDIQAVGISILARTANETGTQNSDTYTSLSGVVNGPFNDGYKRQLVTATVNCRNMVDDN